jgi:hypothetical protein
MARMSASESGTKTIPHAPRSKCVRSHGRTKRDDGQKDHCIARARRFPQVFAAKLNGD